MMEWRLTLDADQPRDGRWRALPQPQMARLLERPEDYVADEALLDAINTSLALGQPLLVTGEPGCGKTELGHFVAWRLGLGRAIRYQTKSDMQARDLFYTFDSVARFHAAQMAAQDRNVTIDAREFITYHGLGEAIIRATEPGKYTDLLPSGFRHDQQQRSVVLIDEVDKAPRDVPNDLLAEIETPCFRVPELGNAIIRTDEMFCPILVLTSNSEKALPDAFLRRCTFYHIPFPDAERLRMIAEKRLGGLPSDGGLVSDAIAVMMHLRTKRKLRKAPGTAELLGFILALRSQGYKPSDQLADDRNQRWVRAAKVTLLKSKDDQEISGDHFRDIDWQRHAGKP